MSTQPRNIALALGLFFGIAVYMYSAIKPQGQPKTDKIPPEDLILEELKGAAEKPSISPPSPSKRLEVSSLAQWREEWSRLGKLPLKDLLSSSPQSSQSQMVGAILGAPFTSLKDRIDRAGWSFDSRDGLPSASVDSSRIQFHVHQGVIIGADVQLGTLTGPDWVRVVEVLVGRTPLGGPEDPMMMIDGLDPSIKLDAIEGEWVGPTGERCAYRLELQPNPKDFHAYFWLRPQE